MDKTDANLPEAITGLKETSEANRWWTSTADARCIHDLLHRNFSQKKKIYIIMWNFYLWMLGVFFL